MAKKGLRYVAVGKLADGATSGATATYTDSKYMGTSAGLTGNISANDVKDYGDDRVVETDTSFQSGTLSWEKNELADEDYAYILGHTYDSTEKTVLANADDIAPYIGLGVVGVSSVDNEDKYLAKFYYKCQFHEPNDENTTKQDSVTFSHTTIEGNVFTLKNGDWRMQKSFDTEAAAIAWVNGLLSISAG